MVSAFFMAIFGVGLMASAKVFEPSMLVAIACKANPHIDKQMIVQNKITGSVSLTPMGTQLAMGIGVICVALGVALFLINTFFKAKKVEA